MKTFIHNIGDRPVQTQIIGAVTTIYPIDSTGDARYGPRARHPLTVAPSARDAVDRFISDHDPTDRARINPDLREIPLPSLADTLLCALARRLTNPDGGYTLQSITMLRQLEGLLRHHKTLTDRELQELGRIDLVQQSDGLSGRTILAAAQG